MWKPGMLAKCVCKSWYRFGKVMEGPAYGDVCAVVCVYRDDEGFWLQISGYEQIGYYEASFFVPIQDQLTEDLDRIEEEPEFRPEPQHEEILT